MNVKQDQQAKLWIFLQTPQPLGVKLGLTRAGFWQVGMIEEKCYRAEDVSKGVTVGDCDKKGRENRKEWRTMER